MTPSKKKENVMTQCIVSKMTVGHDLLVLKLQMKTYLKKTLCDSEINSKHCWYKVSNINQEICRLNVSTKVNQQIC